MLDTVLEIGKILRASPDGLKHHYLIKKPFHNDKNPISFWVIPVSAQGKFNFLDCRALQDEYRQEKLLYLDYKDCDTDNKKMYVFGDIYHQVDQKKKDETSGGNFLISDDDPAGSLYKRNSFIRANSNERLTEFLSSSTVANFRHSFSQQWNTIKSFLSEKDAAYIHFDFDGKHWYQLPVIDELHKSILNTYFEQDRGSYVLRTFLYKTLSANENRTCNFVDDQHFRSRTFKDETEASNLFYGINYLSRPAVRKNDFMVIVLPRGEGLEAKQIERFFERRESNEPGERVTTAELELQTNAEANVAITVDDEDEFFLFANAYQEDKTSSILQYDCIFSKAGGTKPDIDMIEIAGISHSKIAGVSKNIRKIQEEVQNERAAFFLHLYGKPPSKSSPRLTIASAFSKIINDPSKKKSKYQSHLFRVMPQIFNGSYYQDPVLLPSLIEKTEMHVRSDEAYFFNDAKFALKFLFHIQVSGEERFMKIEHSGSYQIGLLLGTMARPLRSKINSFDKHYAGLLSRRIATLTDVIAFANEVNQKLIMHEVLYRDVRQASQKLPAMMNGLDGHYDKNECAFGFFESYFAAWKPTEGLSNDLASDTAADTGA